MYYPIEKIASYDLVHYSFATINEDMTISVGSNFRKFLDVNAKKIIAFGGWDFLLHHLLIIYLERQFQVVENNLPLTWLNYG